MERLRHVFSRKSSDDRRQSTDDGQVDRGVVAGHDPTYAGSSVPKRFGLDGADDDLGFESDGDESEEEVEV